MDQTFIILFCLCLLLNIIRTIYSVLKYKKLINPKNKIIFSVIFSVMVLLWISWFQMCENDPVKFYVPVFLRYAGLSLFILGLLLFIISFFQLRGVENLNHLVTNGIYSITRHPMYLGMIFWVIGYPLFIQSQYSLISSILWIATFYTGEIWKRKNCWKNIASLNLIKCIHSFRAVL